MFMLRYEYTFVGVSVQFSSNPTIKDMNTFSFKFYLPHSGKFLIILCLLPKWFWLSVAVLLIDLIVLFFPVLLITVLSFYGMPKKIRRRS